MYTSVPKMPHEHQLCMDTTNLKLNDNTTATNKNLTTSDQVQIEQQHQQQHLTNSNTLASFYATDEYNNNEYGYAIPSPVLITNLDEQNLQMNKIKVEQVQNDNMNDADAQPTDANQQQRNSTNISTKICKVCGDKSLGKF